MAESTFVRRIEIRDAVSKEKLKEFLESDAPARRMTKPMYSCEERENVRRLLEQYLKKD